MEVSRVKRYVAQHSFQIQHKKRNKPARDGKATKALRAKHAEKSTPPKESRPKRTPQTLQQKRQRERDRWKERYQKAKSLGICRNCDQPAIPGQTRCADCAEKHRVSRRANDRRRRAAAKRLPEAKVLSTPTPPNYSHCTSIAANQANQERVGTDAEISVLSPRQEYEGRRNQRPERKEAHRKWGAQKRQRARDLGLCSDCSNPAILGQTRCETCAEKHRQRRRQSDRDRRATAKADRQSTIQKMNTPNNGSSRAEDK